MIILDENIPASQRLQLRKWRYSVRQIGFDFGRKGVKDDEIIPLLHSARRPTFFTRDSDFFRRRLCHQRYCLVFLDVDRSVAATFARRVLRHPDFDTQAKRLGMVIRAADGELSYYRHSTAQLEQLAWTP